MKFKKFLLIVSFLSFFLTVSYSQTVERPKLVVGIVIDQMRFDYLYRYKQFFGNDGFNRLMTEGSNFTFAHFNYELTSTGPGHASIYTGTTPFYHGIIGNNFYDRFLKKTIYCVNDPDVKSVGSNDDLGQMSPKRLLSTTITDQLKLATNGRSKVIAVSLKDRAAVLPGGHFPNGAFWYDEKTGDFISSTYYMPKLPGWVQEFNNRKLADLYLSQTWNLSLPESDYLINQPDESKYEKDLFDEGKTSFPHSFNKLNEADRYEKIRATPFGNQLVAEFAKAALINEELGKGAETDFLAISFSSTDIIGHEYGTFAYEIMDTYIKLDEQLADLFKELDKQVGKGNYILFLTADHAAMETQAYLRDHNLPTGALRGKKIADSLNTISKRFFGSEGLIESISNKQIFLNRDVLKKNNLDIHAVEQKLVDYMRDTFPEMTSIFTRDYLETQVAARDQINLLLNGYNPSLSGDIAFDLRSGFLTGFMEKGTTHGTTYSYDTHVPLIFYGWHIHAQTINTPVYTTDIAATISNLLNITEPSASIGVPLLNNFK
jgi:predicted AlkP superfamily pyrophosphatase or phosphodiesterase